MPCSRTSTPERGACSCRRSQAEWRRRPSWRSSTGAACSGSSDPQARGRSTVELSSPALPGGEATLPELEPGSFRDPDSRVVTTDGRVLRLLSERGRADWEALASSPLFAELVGGGKLVATREVELEIPCGNARERGRRGARARARALRVLPVRVDVRDAARRGLAAARARAPVDRGGDDPEGLRRRTTSSSTAPGRCSSTSAPSSRCGRASPGPGTGSSACSSSTRSSSRAGRACRSSPGCAGASRGSRPRRSAPLSRRDLLRRGAVTHVALHARLERSHQADEGSVKGDLRASGFRKELILANVGALERRVARLAPRARGSAWSAYEPTTSYVDADAERKEAFVSAALASERPRLVWDLGCNDGRFSRMAAAAAEYVVAVDSDPVVADRLYEALKAEGATRVLPLTIDLTDPSPGQGWRGRSGGRSRTGDDRTSRSAWRSCTTCRSAGTCRSQTCSTGSAGLAGALVIELVTKDDPHGAEDARAQAARGPPRLPARLVRALPRGALHRRRLPGPLLGDEGPLPCPTHPVRRGLSWALRNGAHLAALSAFALAQPIFDILGRNPEFFAVRGSTATEIVLFALVVAFALPTALVALELAASFLSRRLAQGLHLLFVGGLVGLVALHVLAKTDSLSGPAALVGAAVDRSGRRVPVRARSSGARVRQRPGAGARRVPPPLPRRLVRLEARLRRERRGDDGRRAGEGPVVLIVFDELDDGLSDGRQRPTGRRALPGVRVARARRDLVPERHHRPRAHDEGGPRDPRRQLSRALASCRPSPIIRETSSRCSGGATTSGQSRRGRACARPPSAGGRPPAASIPMRRAGPAPSPPTSGSSTCTSFSRSVRGRPAPDQQHVGDFADDEADEQSTRSCGQADDDRPRVRPQRLQVPARSPPPTALRRSTSCTPSCRTCRGCTSPSGKHYGGDVRVIPGDEDGDVDLRPLAGRPGPAAVPAPARLRRPGARDRPATAPRHGRLRPGARHRDRRTTASPSARCAPPKRERGEPRRHRVRPAARQAPRSGRGRIDDSHARTVDILPTIAHVLETRVPWKVEGQSLVGREPPSDATVTSSAPAGDRCRRGSRARRASARPPCAAARLFGTGVTARIYRVGPNLELLGRALGALDVRPSRRASVELDGRELLSVVDLSTDLMPSYLTGSVSGLRSGRTRGGRERDDQSRHEDLQGARRTMFQALVPETALRAAPTTWPCPRGLADGAGARARGAPEERAVVRPGSDRAACDHEPPRRTIRSSRRPWPGPSASVGPRT